MGSAKVLQIDRLAIIGMGLLGGSVARAARQCVSHIIGIDTDKNSLKFALQRNFIDSAYHIIDDGVKKADIVVVCTPVNTIGKIVRQVSFAAKDDAIITDVGSTKVNIHDQLHDLDVDGPYFVGSHPLAGSERSGVAHADADLFSNRLVITTSTPRTNPSALEFINSFWESLGACVVSMDPIEHDRILARTSHFPHVLASTLAGITPPEILQYTAGGWRDTTRIAAGVPSMWAPILLANREAILQALQQFQTQLADVEQMLKAQDDVAIYQWLEDAKKVRDALGS